MGLQRPAMEGNFVDGGLANRRGPLFFSALFFFSFSPLFYLPDGEAGGSARPLVSKV